MQHLPVMLKEVMLHLDLQEGQTVVDCTTGEGGHAVEMLKRIGESGMLLAFDKDEEILAHARNMLGNRSNVRFIHRNFQHLPEVLDEEGLGKADRVLFDLGVSSFHLNSPERGFSFMSEGPLDMRLDRTQQETAADLVNRLSEREIAHLLREYGEEPMSKRIARLIARERKGGNIKTTGQLKELVVRATGGRHGAAHTATRTFQALRIAVNDELASLHNALRSLPEALRACGKAVVITFHSLEDRIVKRVFRELAASGSAEILTPKPVLPSSGEVAANPRSRSAKLRALEVRQS